MRTTHRALCAASIALASILAFSCNNAYGIFSNVQDEVDQKGTKVFQKTAVSNAFLLGTKYYAAIAGGTLQARDAGTTHGWNRVSIGGGSYTLLSAVLDDTNSKIYALVESDGTTAAYSYDGVAWTPLTSPAYAGSNSFSLDELFATSNGQVYAEGHEYIPLNSTTGTSKYSLYHLVGSSLDNPVASFVPADNMSIRGVVYDSLNSLYWFASEDKLFSGAAASGAGAVDSAGTATVGLIPDGLETDTTIWGISYTGTGASRNLFVTTKSGALYRYQAASASASIASVPLTATIEVPGSAGDILLVGSDAIDSTSAVGYYEGTWAGGLALGSASGHTQVALNSSIFSTTVSTFPVHAFFYDGDGTAGKLFICVSPGSSSAKSYGLYSSDWDGVSWSGWLAE